MVDIPRICANCSCEQTPLWRRSPLGPKTLCNACGVRMKKGRLVFVPQTRSFITVESPAAVAKRQRKEREARELKQHLAGARARHGLTKAALPNRNGGAATAAGRHGSHAELPGGQGTTAGGLHHVAAQQQTTSKPIGVAKSGIKRPRKAFKVPQGLYYLLAAIDVVETA